MVPIRNLQNKDNTRVISLIMLYENIKITILKVLGSVVYCIIENYLCFGYLYLQQDKLSLSHRCFENTKFDDISGIGISELLMNIMS